MAIKLISAGAGSGKTYRLTEEMVTFLENGVRPEGIIATTFTQKAAAELQARVRIKLLQKGFQEEADLLSNALIGTVHSLGVKLLKRFAFQAGVSPKVDIIADGDQQILFNKSLATVLSEERIQRMENLCDRLGLNKRDRHDWRKEVKRITDTARSNDFSTKELLVSKEKSFQSFQEFLPEPSNQIATFWNDQLEQLITDALMRLKNNEDQTKVTQSGQNELRNLLNER
jgi:superfamily I DNA/RNA helicase